MQHRRFGRTELDMPVFSTGGMRYQDGWADKPLDQLNPATTDNMEAVIRHSLSFGINHIETAKGYGPSERQLGAVFDRIRADHPRESYILQTKAGPPHTGKEFLANLDGQLKRLRTDYIDLFGMHGLNTHELIERTLKAGGPMEAARQAQKDGKIRHIGFSTHAPLPVLLDAIDAQGDAFGGFDYVNLHHYFIYQRNEPAVAAATARDMGVFIISPTDKGGRLWDPAPELVEFCEPLHPIVFNDLWCLKDERVHTLSLGAARTSDYDLHLEAVEKLDQADELTAPVELRLKNAMRTATGHASPEAIVFDGVPEWYENEHGINAPIMMWLRNLAAGWGMDEYGKMRFGLLGKGDHYFPGISGAEASKLSDQDLMDLFRRSPHAAELPALLRDAIDRLSGVEAKRLSAS